MVKCQLSTTVNCKIWLIVDICKTVNYCGFRHRADLRPCKWFQKGTGSMDHQPGDGGDGNDDCGGDDDDDEDYRLSDDDFGDIQEGSISIKIY